MQTKYLLPGLAVLVLLVGAFWYVQASRVPAAHPPVAGMPSGRMSSSSPFLSSHEPATGVVPNAENLTPSYGVELEALKHTLAQAPRDTTALLRIARLLQDGHQTEEAIPYYKQYLEIHPKGKQAWLDMTQSYGALNQWEEALAATQKMLEHFPEDPSGLYNLGAIYANTNRQEEARSVWERVAAQDKDIALQKMAQDALQRLNNPHP